MMPKAGEYNPVADDEELLPARQCLPHCRCCQNVWETIADSPVSRREKTSWELKFDEMTIVEKIKFMVRHQLGMNWAWGWTSGVNLIYWPVIPYLIESFVWRGLLGLLLTVVGGFICFWKGGRKPAIQKLELMQNEQLRIAQVQTFHDQIQAIRERTLEMMQKQKAYREDATAQIQAITDTLDRSVVSLASTPVVHEAAAPLMQGVAVVSDIPPPTTPGFTVTDITQSQTIAQTEHDHKAQSTAAPENPVTTQTSSKATAAATAETAKGNALDLSQASLGQSRLFTDDYKEPKQALTVAKSILDLQPALASLLLKGSTLDEEEKEYMKMLEEHSPDTSLDVR